MDAVGRGRVTGIGKYGRQLHCNPLLEATIGKRLDVRRDSGQETVCIFFGLVGWGTPFPPWGILGVKSLFSMICNALVSAKYSKQMGCG